MTGEVKRIDSTNREMEITIGSDDGLVVGHELYLYRVSPRPEYLGKVIIVTVDPDQAVARVVGKTYMGKKIKEGDIVSSTVKPRVRVPRHLVREVFDPRRAAGPASWCNRPKSDIYVVLLGISLGAILISCILMIVIFGRYDFSTKVSAIAPAAAAAAIA